MKCFSGEGCYFLNHSKSVLNVLFVTSRTSTIIFYLCAPTIVLDLHKAFLSPTFWSRDMPFPWGGCMDGSKLIEWIVFWDCFLARQFVETGIKVHRTERRSKKACYSFKSRTLFPLCVAPPSLYILLASYSEMWVELLLQVLSCLIISYRGWAQGHGCHVERSFLCWQLYIWHPWLVQVWEALVHSPLIRKPRFVVWLWKRYLGVFLSGRMLLRD